MDKDENGSIDWPEFSNGFETAFAEHSCGAHAKHAMDKKAEGHPLEGEEVDINAPPTKA